MVFGGNPKTPYTDIVQFYSKESPDQTLRPYLELNYTAAGTDGGSGQRIVYLTLRSTHFGGSVFVNGTQHEFPNSLEVVLDVPTGLLHDSGVSKLLDHGKGQGGLSEVE